MEINLRDSPRYNQPEARYEIAVFDDRGVLAGFLTGGGTFSHWLTSQGGQESLEDARERLRTSPVKGEFEDRGYAIRIVKAECRYSLVDEESLP